LTETPRTTVQRYLEQLTSAGVVERKKAERAFKYCLSDPCGELPTCPQLPAPDSVMAEHVGTSASCSASDAEDDDWGRSSREPHDSVANVDAVGPIIFNSMDPNDLDKDDWTPENAEISEHAGTDPASGRTPIDCSGLPSSGHAGLAELGNRELAAEPNAQNLMADSADLNGVGGEAANTTNSDED